MNRVHILAAVAACAILTACDPAPPMPPENSASPTANDLDDLPGPDRNCVEADGSACP